MLLPFISHSFLKSLVRLDVAARSRVVYDVAARQVREARVPPPPLFIVGPPAHRIHVEPMDAAALCLAGIVVADLELPFFGASLRVQARRHAGRKGPTHHEAPASRGIVKRLG